SNYYKPFHWLTVDADIAYAHARFRDYDPVGQHIPGAVEGVACQSACRRDPRSASNRDPLGDDACAGGDGR
ncbi:hypothetical protein, partial [Sphingomonas sp. 10B4]